LPAIGYSLALRWRNGTSRCGPDEGKRSVTGRFLWLAGLSLAVLVAIGALGAAVRARFWRGAGRPLRRPRSSSPAASAPDDLTRHGQRRHFNARTLAMLDHAQGSTTRRAGDDLAWS